MKNIKTAQADAELLGRFIPVDACTEEDLIVLTDHAWVEEVAVGHVLARAGESDGWDYFLIQGTLKLVASDGKEMTIEDNSPTAKTAIARLQPRRYTISALTPVKYLRVQAALLTNLSSNKSGFSVEESSGIPEEKDNPLYLEINDDLINNQLSIPSMPEVAVKARRLIENEDVAVEELARLIGTDPSLSAKLIKAANGVLYHGQPTVETSARAIMRLGLKTTKHLILAFVLRNVFNEKIRDPHLVKMTKKLWNHSVQVAAVSMALARVTPGMDAEEAMVAGLVHDIGELVILSYAEKYPELVTDQDKLRAVIEQFKGDLGAAVLRQWNFPDALVTAAREAELWQRGGAERADYADVVLVAQVHCFIGTPKMKSLPSMMDMPAFAKLAGGQLSPEVSRKILDAAKDLIRETQQLLAA
jgi:putative nucleotidyltransferase with HDIG domain